jgi:minor curlin subunit
MKSCRPSGQARLLALGLWSALSAHAADLSLISDFGRPDLPQERMGLAPSGQSTVGVEQVGQLNKVWAQQASQGANNLQVWQSGTDLEATLVQQGQGNVLRMSQSNANNTVDVMQDGLNNGLALVQYGDSNSVTGQQLGDGNQAVVTQPGAATFSFTQQGSLNQIVADMPAGLMVHVDQIGDGLSFSITPQQ